MEEQVEIFTTKRVVYGLLGIFVALCIITYVGIVNSQEDSKKSWSNVENTYQVAGLPPRLLFLLLLFCALSALLHTSKH